MWTDLCSLMAEAVAERGPRSRQTESQRKGQRNTTVKSQTRALFMPLFTVFISHLQNLYHPTRK